jgi:hypothetical protein
MAKTIDKRFGSWSPKRRAVHAKSMAKWAKSRRKAGQTPGPAVQLRELRAAVSEIVGRMERADSATRTGWAAELRKVVGTTASRPSPHNDDDEIADVGCCYCCGPVENNTRYDACEGCREQKGLDGDGSDE